MIGAVGITELIVLGILLLPLLLWIFALVDILRSEFTSSNKIVWLLVVIFLPVIGFILYFLIGTKQKIK
jgi:hypothetical protein